MITLAVNEQNDIYVGADGNLALARDADALAQLSAQAIKALRGEMVFDTGRGMPNMTTVWAGTSNLPRYEAAARQRLLALPGVRSIVSLTSTREGDAFRYRAELRTIYGPVIANG